MFVLDRIRFSFDYADFNETYRTLTVKSQVIIDNMKIT
jgi:hypothetical protein